MADIFQGTHADYTYSYGRVGVRPDGQTSSTYHYRKKKLSRPGDCSKEKKKKAQGPQPHAKKKNPVYMIEIL